MLRQITALGTTVTVAAMLVTTTTASADGWGTVDCDQAPTPQCQIGAGQQSERPGHSSSNTSGEEQGSGGGPGPAGGEHLANCGYRPSEFRPPVGPAGQGLVPSSWYEGLCSTTGVIQTPVEVPTLSPAEVARLARNQLGLPEPEIASSPATDQLVNLPTWLWLDSGWETRSATASVPGVSVTATAQPSSVSWSMGDGHTVTCNGPGTAFRQEADPRSPSPDCGHTYRRSSATQPNGAFPVVATVHWSVGWSGAGESGTFADLTTTATARFQVAESQALNDLPAPR